MVTSLIHTCSFLLFAFILQAQELRLRCANSVDTLETHMSDSQFDSLIYDLSSVKNSKFPYYVRVHFNWWTIDLYSIDMEHFNGFVTTSAIRYCDNKSCPKDSPDQFVSLRFPIDSTTAGAISRELLRSGQFTIPTGTRIPSWNLVGTNCTGLNYQIMIDGIFKKLKYSCPFIQNDSAEFKHIVTSNYTMFIESLDFGTIRSEFLSMLPHGNYSHYGCSMMLITPRPKNRYKKKCGCVQNTFERKR